MASVFTKIISKEIPCYKIAENQDFIAFLDINPNSLGHTLCVPKTEVDDFLDLEKESYNKLMSFSKLFKSSSPLTFSILNSKINGTASGDTFSKSWYTIFFFISFI